VFTKQTSLFVYLAKFADKYRLKGRKNIYVRGEPLKNAPATSFGEAKRWHLSMAQMTIIKRTEMTRRFGRRSEIGPKVDSMALHSDCSLIFPNLPVSGMQDKQIE